MANKFPVTLNSSTNRLEEIRTSDNLNLTNNGIYDGTSAGTSGQVLTSSGSGGVSWSTISSGGATNLNGLSDVTITSATTGQVLKYDGSKWVNGTDVSGTSGVTSISALTDVNLGTLSNNQLLRYNNTSSKWENFSPTYLTSTGSINTHTDVTITSAATGNLLRYNGSNWVNWAPNFLTSYSETDTLATVTARGASTTAAVTFQNVTISGNLSVTGTTTTVNTTELNVGNSKITLLSGQQTPTTSALIEVDRGSSVDVSIRWNEVDDRWEFTNDGTNFYKIPFSTADLLNGANFISSTGSINSHTDVTISNPTNGQVLKYNGTSWINDTDLNSGGGTIGLALVQETEPLEPEDGTIWLKKSESKLQIYAEDEWINPVPESVGGTSGGGAKFIQSTTPNIADSEEGDLWFDFTMPGLFSYTKVDQTADPASYVWVQV